MFFRNTSESEPVIAARSVPATRADRRLLAGPRSKRLAYIIQLSRAFSKRDRNIPQRTVLDAVFIEDMFDDRIRWPVMPARITCYVAPLLDCYRGSFARYHLNDLVRFQ